MRSMLAATAGSFDTTAATVSADAFAPAVTSLILVSTSGIVGSSTVVLTRLRMLICGPAVVGMAF